MRLNAVFAVLSVELLLVVFDIAYDLSFDYRSLNPIEALDYNKQYST